MKARDRVFSAVVSIVAIKETHEAGRVHLARSGGSGTIISREGHIVTNAHVTMNGTKFQVILADRSQVDAVLVGEDPLSDIAVLKLDPDDSEAITALNVAQFGNSDEIEIGDLVLAMGAPWGMSHSMSLGIVNNNKRLLSTFFDDDADYESNLDRDQPTGSFYRWIQHDAAIAPGNSGGPLVSLKGEIIGVNTLGIPFGGNMGFASPSNVVKEVTRQLIEHGEVIRSFIGVQFKPTQSTEYDRGVLINAVDEGSPAGLAGMQPGDLLLTINDEPVTVLYKEQMPEFRRYLSGLPVGTDLRVKLQRGSKQREIQFVTTKYEKDLGPRLGLKDWGLTFREITPRMARNRRLSEASGLLVTGVALGSPAATAKPQLKIEDVILTADGTSVGKLDDFDQWFNSWQDAPGQVLVEFEREGEQLMTVLKPRREEDSQRLQEIDKAWLPIEVQALDATLARQAGLDGITGFRVTRIYDEVPDFQSGLAVGDIITGIGDEALRPRNSIDKSTFERVLHRMSVSDIAQLHIVRDGKPRTLQVKLLPAPRHADEAVRSKDSHFDLEVRNVTFFDVAKNRWNAGTSGVIVTEVESGGWAGIGHLRADDLILQVDGKKILDVDQFATVMESLGRHKKDTTRLLVLRGIETRLLYLQPDWK